MRKLCLAAKKEKNKKLRLIKGKRCAGVFVISRKEPGRKPGLFLPARVMRAWLESVKGWIAFVLWALGIACKLSARWYVLWHLALLPARLLQIKRPLLR